MYCLIFCIETSYYDIYNLSLHDALPISKYRRPGRMKKYAQRSFFKARFRRPERVSEGAGSVCTGACDVAGRGRVVVVVMSSARFVQHGLEVLQHQLASGVEPFLLARVDVGDRSAPGDDGVEEVPVDLGEFGVLPCVFTRDQGVDGGQLPGLCALLVRGHGVLQQVLVDQGELVDLVLLEA